MLGRLKLNQWRWCIKQKSFLWPSSQRWTVRFWSCRLLGRISVCWSFFLMRFKMKPLAFRRWDSTGSAPKSGILQQSQRKLILGSPKNLSENCSKKETRKKDTWNEKIPWMFLKVSSLNHQWKYPECIYFVVVLFVNCKYMCRVLSIHVGFIHTIFYVLSSLKRHWPTRSSWSGPNPAWCVNKKFEYLCSDSRWRKPTDLVLTKVIHKAFEVNEEGTEVQPPASSWWKGVWGSRMSLMQTIRSSSSSHTIQPRAFCFRRFETLAASLFGDLVRMSRGDSEQLLLVEMLVVKIFTF